MRTTYAPSSSLTSAWPACHQPATETSCTGSLTETSFTGSLSQAVTAVIMLNTLAMAMEHRGQSTLWDDTLHSVNDACAFVFLADSLLKMAALGVHDYFQEGWNTFDLVIVCVSMVGVIASYVSTAKTGFLSVLRVLRVTRVFRLIPKAKALRKLFSTLIAIIPACANVTGVLLLFYFVYSVAGMNLFGHVLEWLALNRHVNFYNFPSSMLARARVRALPRWHSCRRCLGPTPVARLSVCFIL